MFPSSFIGRKSAIFRSANCQFALSKSAKPAKPWFTFIPPWKVEYVYLMPLTKFGVNRTRSRQDIHI